MARRKIAAFSVVPTKKTSRKTVSSITVAIWRLLVFTMSTKFENLLEPFMYPYAVMPDATKIQKSSTGMFGCLIRKLCV